jgi:hypothetical protein
MTANDSRPPIWFWMIIILICALYTAGICVLMEPQVRGPEQSSTKIWVGFWLCVLSVFVVPGGIALCKREERANFFGIFRPVTQEVAKPRSASEQETFEPLGLTEGQRLRLPDGSECVVLWCHEEASWAMLDYIPRRESEEHGSIVTEQIGVDHNRDIWRYREQNFGPRLISSREATGWKLDDLETIVEPA